MSPPRPTRSRAGPGTVAWTLGYNAASQVATDARSNSAYVLPTSQIGNVTADYTVNGLDQYTAVNAASFGYDANANLTSDGTWAYTYDDENRLVQAVSSGGTVTLTYDPLGRLFETSKSTPSTTTRFLYDGDAMVIQYNGSNAISNRYVHGSNAAADDPLLWYSGGALMTKNWLHADHLGSIVAIADSTGANPVINTYDEYGINGSGNSQTERFGYTGQAWIPELNLYYYKARFYSPNLGRFLQTDPIGYDGGVNLYGYVGDDPANLNDPTGSEPATDQVFVTGNRECNTCHKIHGFAPPPMPRLPVMPRFSIILPSFNVWERGLACMSLQIILCSDGANVEEGVEPSEGAEPGPPTKGPSKQYEKPGGFKEANEDFDAAKPENVSDKGNGVRVGKLSGGRTIIVRPKSNEGRPTVEVRRPNGRGYEVRYGPK